MTTERPASVGGGGSDSAVFRVPPALIEGAVLCLIRDCENGAWRETLILACAHPRPATEAAIAALEGRGVIYLSGGRYFRADEQRQHSFPGLEPWADASPPPLSTPASSNDEGAGGSIPPASGRVSVGGAATMTIWATLREGS